MQLVAVLAILFKILTASVGVNGVAELDENFDNEAGFVSCQVANLSELSHNHIGCYLEWDDNSFQLDKDTAAEFLAVIIKFSPKVEKATNVTLILSHDVIYCQIVPKESTKENSDSIKCITKYNVDFD